MEVQSGHGCPLLRGVSTHVRKNSASVLPRQNIAGILGGYGVGGTCVYIKVLGPTPYIPTSKQIITEGILG